MKDLLSNVNPRVAIAPQVITNANTVLTGNTIDRSGYESVTYLVALGAVTDADMTGTVKLQHGDLADGSDMADCAVTDYIGTAALGSFTFADDNVCKKVGYQGSKQFTRIVVTPANNDAGALPISAIALLGHAHARPTDNPPT